VSPARGPPTDWAEFVQVHHDRDVLQSSPDELPVMPMAMTAANKADRQDPGSMHSVTLRPMPSA
jgi:hypothetical protein